MKLSRSQIKYIDDYLKHHKFKYWDIRFEVLDHIVNTVESKMEQGITFDDAMIEAHQSFGNSMKMFWNTGVEYSIFTNGNGYKNLIQNKKKELNKKYRNFIFKEFKNFFTSISNLVILLIIILIETNLYSILDHKTFTKVHFLLLLIPLLIYIFISIQDHKKSKILFTLTTIYGQLILPFLLVGTVGKIIKTNLPAYISYSIFIGYLVLSFIWFYSSLKVYHKTEKKYTELYKELQSI